MDTSRIVVRWPWRKQRANLLKDLVDSGPRDVHYATRYVPWPSMTRPSSLNFRTSLTRPLSWLR